MEICIIARNQEIKPQLNITHWVIIEQVFCSVMLNVHMSFFISQLLSGSQSSRPQLKPSTPTLSQTMVVPSSPHTTTPNYSTSLVTRKRGHTFDFETDTAKRRRGAQSYSSRQSGEKQHNKGLRHFSQRVCEKVREKGATTYNEVRSQMRDCLYILFQTLIDMHLL